MTGGGADYCFECVGHAPLVQEAFACCRKVLLSFRTQAHTTSERTLNITLLGHLSAAYINFYLDFFSCHLSLELQGWGKTIVLGVDKPGAQVTLPSFDILQGGKSLMGSLFGGLKPKSDITILLKRYTDKVI